MPRVNIHLTKSVSPTEFAELMASVGWGSSSDYDASKVSRSIASYPFIAHARSSDGALVGYVSAFSDGAFSTFIGEIVVHPELQGEGVGSMLLAEVELHYRGVPVYAKPFEEQEAFFLRNGYRRAPRAMSVVFKRNEAGG